MFPGETYEHISHDQKIDDMNNYYPKEFLNTLQPNGLPPNKLKLKVNCPTILLRNQYTYNGLYNGVRMMCKCFEKKSHTCKNSRKTSFLTKNITVSIKKKKYSFHFKIKQFLMLLRFQMTTQ